MQVWLFKSIAVAPAGACAPLKTSRTWPASITMVLSPSTLPAAVSMRWPHNSAVTLGAAGASAADANPTDRRTATPAVSTRVAAVRFIKEKSRIFVCHPSEGATLGAAFQHRPARRSIGQGRNIFPQRQRRGEPRRFDAKYIDNPGNPVLLRAYNPKVPRLTPRPEPGGLGRRGGERDRRGLRVDGDLDAWGRRSQMRHLGVIGDVGAAAFGVRQHRLHENVRVDDARGGR